MSRFQQVTVLDTPFERAADFDLPTYWQNHIQEFLATLSEYAFTVRLDSRRMASSKWYTPGRTEILEPPGEDGWLTARFWVESQDMARLFVLSLEDQAVVVEPVELRGDVRKAARTILDRYS